ncbi:hypothetical protein CJJ09_001968 [Candidozyma auris]|nr:hypothetical protein CJJ09_001968 [[Candida] auris]
MTVRIQQGHVGILLKFFGYELSLKLDDLESGKSLVNSAPGIPGGRRAESVSSISKDSLSLSSGGSSFAFQSSNTNIKSVYYSLETGSMDDASSGAFSLYHQEEHPALSRYIPEDLHRSLWSALKNCSPDNFLLRIIRLANNDRKVTLKWVAEVLDFRINKYPVTDIVFEGDAGPYFEGKSPKLIEAFRRNEVYVRGNSRSGCPLIVVRAKEHFRSNCPDADYEKLIIMHFEWSFLAMQEFKRGVDQAHVLFDLTGFTLKNADFHAVKMVVKLFQRIYPDCVEKVYIHKAPKIFSVMWNIIELRKYIESKYIPKSLGGKDKHIPTYIEPTEFNCKKKEPDALLGNLLRQRDDLTIKYIENTIKWIEATTPEESKAYLDEKVRLSKARAQNYVFLDPYLRMRGPHDRNGEILSISY